MEYINIVSKEAVTAPPDWCFKLTLGICIIILGIGLIISLKKNCIKLLMISGGIAIIVEVALLLIFIWFCSVPTGNYKYSATLDKETITVAEYEEFLHKYNPKYVDGVYYWISEELADVSNN